MAYSLKPLPSMPLHLDFSKLYVEFTIDTEHKLIPEQRWLEQYLDINSAEITSDSNYKMQIFDFHHTYKIKFYVTPENEIKTDKKTVQIIAIKNGIPCCFEVPFTITIGNENVYRPNYSYVGFVEKTQIKLIDKLEIVIFIKNLIIETANDMLSLWKKSKLY